MKEKEQNFPNKINSKSENTKKIKKFDIYDLENASNTFQKLMGKYKKAKYSYKKEPKNIISIIEKARIKAERLETENEFMMKELKKNIRLEQELIALYGPRAKKHYYEIDKNKFNSKINKYDFFTPKEIKRLKETKRNSLKSIKSKKEVKPELSNIIFKGRKSHFSPTIMSQNRPRFYKTFSRELKSNKSTSQSTKFKSFYKTSTNNIKNRNYRPYQTFDGNNMYFKTIENSKINRNKIVKNKLFLNTDINKFKEKEKIFNDNSNFTLTLNKDISNNEFNINKIVYLDELIKINKQFLKKEKKIKNHFNNNDYGCGFSKLQYIYLTKKYYN